MQTTAVAGGTNIALKIPHADYDATVRFYRDTLGFDVEEVADTGSPTVSRSHVLDFGPCRLWLDRVDTLARADVWLELRTDDLEATTERLRRAGTEPCDEIEPLEALGSQAHWIRDPAGVVHLLAAEPVTGSAR